MNILHTSDWHLGQNLMFKDRKDEHKAFLNWLIKTIKEEDIDLLIIAGDIFDTGNPPNYALKIYYQFLVEVANIKTCRDIIVIGGNHDSVSTLNAPRELLSFINVSVVGGISENLRDEIVIVKDEMDKIISIVCAVPFLRERDIRKSLAGETYQEKSHGLMIGIKNHYKEVYNEAMLIKKELNLDIKIPIIATGHLFTAGGMTSDGIRDIYVGNLGKFESDSFPNGFDYIALGHLHKSQIVDKNEFVRFSGSPIPLSFGEASKPKEVVKISFPAREIKIIEIPVFKKLFMLEGTLKEIKAKIFELKEADEEMWLEVYVKNDWKYDLVKEINAYIEDTKLVIFKVSGLNNTKIILNKNYKIMDLSECSVFDVFNKRLDTNSEIDEDSKIELNHMFNEIYNEIHEDQDEN